MAEDVAREAVADVYGRLVGSVEYVDDAEAWRRERGD
jgi:hypothetical protein